MILYDERKFVQLAQAVQSGFPMEEAEKILASQRENAKQHAKDLGKSFEDSNEKYFWLELKKNDISPITSIQLSRGTKSKLESLKEGRDSYEDIILRLMERCDVK